MRSLHVWRLSLLTCGLTALTAACGLPQTGLDGARAKGRGTLAAQSVWEPPTVLEDFDSTANQYDHYGPVSHPFFDPLEFTPLKPSAAGSTVLEILGANRPKPRKGFLFTADVEDAGALVREVNEKPVMAEQVKVGFKWANNGAPTTDPCLYAQVVFVFDSKRLGRRGLGYVWSNRHCPGAVLTGQLGNGEGALPLRLICLAQGVGLGQPCGEAALNKMSLTAVERDFAADVRWAFSESTPAGEIGIVADRGPGGCEPARVQPPRVFTSQSNADLTGIIGLAFGAELAKGICSHAIVDDVWVQKAWPR
ncbi:MAG: hypothetical protein VKP62_01750 [Candidatus Sericytochromatia bacterium]|nr:hypothetical protein [Candidatus Sericytochromatia bacterium]